MNAQFWLVKENGNFSIMSGGLANPRSDGDDVGIVRVSIGVYVRKVRGHDSSLMKRLGPYLIALNVMKLPNNHSRDPNSPM